MIVFIFYPLIGSPPTAPMQESNDCSSLRSRLPPPEVLGRGGADLPVRPLLLLRAGRLPRAGHAGHAPPRRRPQRDGQPRHLPPRGDSGVGYTAGVGLSAGRRRENVGKRTKSESN